MPFIRDLFNAARRSWRIVLKELSAFGVVGVVNFGLDLAIYQFLYVQLGQGALVSKVISTLVTSTLAYFMHRHWSFSHRARTGLKREYGLFVALSAMSLLMGLLVIGMVRYGLGRTDVFALQLANITSIFVGSVFRFWAYKRWVFPAAEIIETCGDIRVAEFDEGERYLDELALPEHITQLGARSPKKEPFK